MATPTGDRPFRPTSQDRLPSRSAVASAAVAILAVAALAVLTLPRTAQPLHATPPKQSDVVDVQARSPAMHRHSAAIPAVVAGTAASHKDPAQVTEPQQHSASAQQGHGSEPDYSVPPKRAHCSVENAVEPHGTYNEPACVCRAADRAPRPSLAAPNRRAAARLAQEWDAELLALKQAHPGADPSWLLQALSASTPVGPAHKAAAGDSTWFDPASSR